MAPCPPCVRLCLQVSCFRENIGEEQKKHAFRHIFLACWWCHITHRRITYYPPRLGNTDLNDGLNLFVSKKLMIQFMFASLAGQKSVDLRVVFRHKAGFMSLYCGDKLRTSPSSFSLNFYHSEGTKSVHLLD